MFPCLLPQPPLTQPQHSCTQDIIIICNSLIGTLQNCVVITLHIPLMVSSSFTVIAISFGGPCPGLVVTLSIIIEEDISSLRSADEGESDFHLVSGGFWCSRRDRYTVITIIKDEKGVREEQVKCWIHGMRKLPLTGQEVTVELYRERQDGLEAGKQRAHKRRVDRHRDAGG